MGSIQQVLSIALFTARDLLSGTGGFAAAVPIGAFIGQARSGFQATTEQERRRDIAIGGFIGMALLIGLILFSGK
jgi:hypothetical protein